MLHLRRDKTTARGTLYDMETIVRFITTRLSNERLVRLALIAVIVWSITAALAALAAIAKIARTEPVSSRPGRTRIEPLR